MLVKGSPGEKRREYSSIFVLFDEYLPPGRSTLKMMKDIVRSCQPDFKMLYLYLFFFV